jgi:hypothetical protein
LPENYGTEEDLAGEEIEKAMRLTEQSGNMVFLLCGAIDIAQSPVIIGFSFTPTAKYTATAPNISPSHDALYVDLLVSHWLDTCMNSDVAALTDLMMC